MSEHHAGCAINEKLGDVCTCGADKAVKLHCWTCGAPRDDLKDQMFALDEEREPLCSACWHAEYDVPECQR